MKKCYNFAGIGFEIEIPDEKMYTDEHYLAPFRVESVQDPHCFRFELVEELTAPKGECIANEPAVRVYQEGDWNVRYIGSVQESWDGAYARAAHCEREHIIQLKQSQFPQTVGVHSVLNCLSMEHILAENNGTILHSSYIERLERAILFTAPSGVGKSTQAALWEKLRGADVINGDRTALRIIDDRAYACGIPFAGSSRICKNVTMPLGVIVYLKQAPVTTIRRLRGAEAFCRVWEGCSVNTWDWDDVARASKTVQDLLQSTPVFELSCTPDETALLALEGALLG